MSQAQSGHWQQFQPHHERGFASQRAVTATAGLLIIGFGLVLNTSLLRTVATTCKARARRV